MGRVDLQCGQRGRDRQVRPRPQRPGRRRRRSARRAPGSGEIGRVAVGGFVPVGYYKDPEKSAATFVEIDGKRYSMPGDYATVEADGSLTLLGRGSVCINTGGEKVFPEEVEEALKSHPAVHDAVAVGIPDEKFGEAVTAVVEPDGDALVDEGRGHRPREADAGRLQGPEAGPHRRHHRARPQRQGRLQGPAGLRRVTRCASDPDPVGAAPERRTALVTVLVVAPTTRRGRRLGPRLAVTLNVALVVGLLTAVGGVELPPRPTRRRVPASTWPTRLDDEPTATRPRTSSSSAPTAPPASTPTTP